MYPSAIPVNRPYAVYDAVQAEIDARRPLCDMSGRCCNFEAYGHRLYVTTIELAAFSGQLPAAAAGTARFETAGTRGGLALPQWRVDAAVQPIVPVAAPTDDGTPSTATSCPFQSNNLCGVHEIRPFGCRMFFCDPLATEWQKGLYERFHADIKALHESLGVPYFYVEWRAALRDLGLGEPTL